MPFTRPAFLRSTSTLDSRSSPDHASNGSFADTRTKNEKIPVSHVDRSTGTISGNGTAANEYTDARDNAISGNADNTAVNDVDADANNALFLDARGERLQDDDVKENVSNSQNGCVSNNNSENEGSRLNSAEWSDQNGSKVTSQPRVPSGQIRMGQNGSSQNGGSNESPRDESNVESSQSKGGSNEPKVLTCPPGIRIDFCPIKHTFIDFPTTPIASFPAPPLTTPASFAPALDLLLTTPDPNVKPQMINLFDLVSSPKKKISMPYGLRQPFQAPGPALAT